jgi:hypothetical protein
MGAAVSLVQVSGEAASTGLGGGLATVIQEQPAFVRPKAAATTVLIKP